LPSLSVLTDVEVDGKLVGGFIYLASPFKHDDLFVQTKRYEAARDATSYMTLKGAYVYSPIVHNHALATTRGMPRGWQFWKYHDLTMLLHARVVQVLLLDGWEESEGCLGEVEQARKWGIPVEGIDPATCLVVSGDPYESLDTGS
jgi:hypothetical protein